jgi:hypothetical protein
MSSAWNGFLEGENSSKASSNHLTAFCHNPMKASKKTFDSLSIVAKSKQGQGSLNSSTLLY